MADSAEGTLYWTRWQFWVSLGGLGGLLASLKWTREAVILSRQAMTNAERAYVGFTGCSWRSHKQDNGKFVWRFRVMWANTGNTPTRHMSTQVIFRLTDEPLGEFAYLGIPPGHHLISIPPGQLVSSGLFDVGQDDLQRVKEGTKHLYAWGVATYRDVFDRTPDHVTKFFVQGVNVTGDPKKGWDAKMNPLSVDFIHLARHNCSDEECK